MLSELLEAIVLGVVQGLTEFLPVSSSGHLELAKVIMGDDSLSEQSMLMTVSLHAATALSTIFVFWKDIKSIFFGVFKKEGVEQRNYVLKIILSMIPAVCIGLFFEEFIESLFSRNVLLVGLMLFVTGAILFVADKTKRTDRKVSFKDALLIGIAQAIAILPGISRSGATISTSVILGIDREASARFSFLMVIPLIFGKMAKDLLDGSYTLVESNGIPLICGFIAAFITGILACKLMIGIVKKSKLEYFSFYCFIVGTIAIAYHFFF